MLVMWMRVSFWTMSALARGLILRIRGPRAALALPSCEGEQIESQRSHWDIGCVVRLVDCLQRVIVPRTRHRCFYRSYSRAIVLRKLGVPAVLNIGLRNLDPLPASRVRGHCWVTLSDEPLLERKVPEKYPILLAETPTGVRYWAGRNDPPAMKRKRVRMTGRPSSA